MGKKAAADLLKAKEAKQKKIAIVGFVLLLAIVGFQAPRTMKMLNGADSAAAETPPAATASAPTDGGLALPPVTTGGAAGTAPAPTAAAPAGDTGPAPAAGQLVSFTRFASKDPFVQQIDPGATGAAGDEGEAVSSGDAPAGGGDTRQDGSTPGSATGPGSTSGSTKGSGDQAGAPTTATLVVNGVREEVAVGAEFPRSGPFFLLVKLGPSSAQIGVAGGSYASGERTATVRKGRTLTLQNTADGTRYEIRLAAVS